MYTISNPFFNTGNGQGRGQRLSDWIEEDFAYFKDSKRVTPFQPGKDLGDGRPTVINVPSGSDSRIKGAKSYVEAC